MLRIEKDSDKQTTFIRLIGRIQARDVSELNAQMEGSGSRLVLDLEQVTLVDVDAVRFLCDCKDRGVELAQCAPYIHEWILRERTEGEMS